MPKQAGKLKKKIYNILHDSEGKTGLLYVIDDYFISGLIVLNVIVIILESYESLYSEHYNLFHTFDFISVAVFSLEYALRIWISDMVYPEYSPTKARMKYIFSMMGMIDLLAILPFYIPFLIKMDLRFLRILRLLRLFRIFKLVHYSKSLRLVGVVIKRQQRELLITVFGTFIIILLTSSLMFEIEHEVQPDKFPNIFATFWWAVATLTTIGYGDVFPITGWGQFLAAVTAIFGIGMVAIPTGLLSMGFMEEMQRHKKAQSEQKESKKAEEEKFQYCPHCGKKLP